jgi:succinoglycan biosynthesis protein ExoA
VRLGVFTGDRYWREGAVISSDVAFVRFLSGLAEQVSELVVFGRLVPSPGSAANVLSAPSLRFVALPDYERLSDLGSVVRARGESERVFAAGIEGLDAAWIFGPHPLAHRLVQIAERSSVRVFLGARMDFPRYVRYRSRGAARLWALPAGIALDRSFRRLTRSRPTVVVGEALARHYGGRETLVSGFSLVRDADLVAAEAPLKPWGETVKLLTVTRLEEEKNPLLLPEILRHLRTEGDWRLEVVGAGPLDVALEEKARRLGLTDAVELSGYVPFGDELRERYRRADAFLHVSLTEGLPQVLFEAAAAGLPIVATDVGGVAKALGSERGLVVPPGDAGAAARALLALRDESLRSRLASAALEYARTRTLEQQAGEILRFFNSSLEPTRDSQRSSGVSAPVSVVIPALNEAATIERCVRSVLAQRPAPHELIVVDGGSNDGTPELARSAGALVLENPDRIIPAALNRGLAAATGEVFLRFDAHAEMPEGYLAACLRALEEEPGAANVGGWCDVRSNGRWGRALAGALSSRLGVGNARLWRAPDRSSVRREVDSVPFGCFPIARLRAAGGWEQGLPVNEDYELNARLRAAGGKVIFDPAVRAVYFPRETLREIARQYWRYGRWKAAMLKRSPRSLRSRQLAPPALVGLAVVACVPRRETVPARVALGGYAVGVGVATLRARSGWRTAVVLASMHLSWGSGFFYGLVKAVRGNGSEQSGEPRAAAAAARAREGAGRATSASSRT